MNKIEFVLALQDRLKGLPKEDLRRSLEYYNEMIDDRMEDGLTEEQAVAAIGSLDEITMQILAETPMTKLVTEKLKPKKKLKTWQVVALAAGAPVWVSLLLAAAAIVFSIYVSIWSVIISLYAAVFAIAVSAVAAVPGAAIICFFGGNPLAALSLLGAGAICGGLSIFLFIGCKYTIKGVLWLSRQLWLWLKSLIIGKETAQ